MDSHIVSYTRFWFVVIFSIGFFPASGLAAGFYITEIGTPGSLGTAGAANPTNTFHADSSWTNPAGMTGLDKDVMVAGLQFVVPKIEFDPSVAEGGGKDGGNAGNAIPIPSLFYVKTLSDRSRFGFSVIAPQGGGVNYGDDFVGRYSASKAELGVIGISPSLAYKVTDRLSLGGGVSALYTKYEINIAFNSSAIIPGTPDAKIKVENATDWGLQPFVGMTFKLNEQALLGIVYRAKSDVDLDGDVNVRNWSLPTAVPDLTNAEISWDNPQWLDVGLRYTFSEKNTIFLNGGWQDWSEFSDNGIEVSGAGANIDTEIDREWDDTWYARFGFAHDIGDQSAYTFGVSYDSSPVNDKHRTFDLPVEEYYKFSAAYAWKGKNKLNYALGATLLMVGNAKIDQTSQGVRAAGKFDTNYILLAGGTVRYAF
jgi:long-chain fatty acid transport protein